jgi:hypothetical protein
MWFGCTSPPVKWLWLVPVEDRAQGLPKASAVERECLRSCEQGVCQRTNALRSCDRRRRYPLLAAAAACRSARGPSLSVISASSRLSATRGVLLFDRTNLSTDMIDYFPEFRG